MLFFVCLLALAMGCQNRQATKSTGRGHVHTGAGKEVVSPTCQREGERVYICQTCGKKYKTEKTGKKEHNGQWRVTRCATCTKKGTRKKICKDCGQVLAVEEIPKLPHYYEWKTVKTQRCKSDGKEELRCINCGAVRATRVLKELGHWYKDCICIRCGYETDADKAAHQLVLSDYMLDDIGLGLAGDVEIPSKVTYKGETYDVIGIGNNLCYQNKDLLHVTLPAGIKYIRSHAFDFCENLESCNLPAGLLRIGDAAFQCCYQLKHIELPDSLEVLGNFAFNHCSGVDNQEITIPDNIRRLGKFEDAPAHMFYDCGTDDFTAFVVNKNRYGYMVQDGILYAGDGSTLVAIPRGKTFQDNTYVMPDTVEQLGELSFSRNKNIQTVVVSDRLLVTGEPTEKQFQSFNNIGNPLSVACYVYADVRKYQAKETNPNYQSIDGILYSKDGKTIVAIPNKYQGVINIPEGVTTWQKEALWTDINDFVDLAFCEISEIHIPKSLCSIEEGQITAINRIAELYGTRIVVAEDNPAYTATENRLACR